MKNLILERDDMSDFERQLFIKDLKPVLDEYFEVENAPTLEVTRTEEGFLVCVLFTSRRIKTVKHAV